MWPMKQILWGGMDRRMVNFLLEKSELEGSGSLRITHARLASHLGAVREVVIFPERGDGASEPGGVRLTER